MRGAACTRVTPSTTWYGVVCRTLFSFACPGHCRRLSRSCLNTLLYPMQHRVWKKKDKRKRTFSVRTKNRLKWTVYYMHFWTVLVVVKLYQAVEEKTKSPEISKICHFNAIGLLMFFFSTIFRWCSWWKERRIRFSRYYPDVWDWVECKYVFFCCFS